VASVSVSQTYSAWHGFFGWFAALCALAGAAVLAVEFFAPQIKLPAPGRLITAGLFALATICVLLALVVVPAADSAGSGISINKGHGFGYWISLIVIIAGLVLSILRLKATGGKLPWEKGGGNTAPPQQPWQGGGYQQQ
jgi:hypothetical protein